MIGVSSFFEEVPYQEDSNRTLGEGCQTCAKGGIRSITSPFLSMGMDVKLEPIGCESFHHVCGENNKEYNLLIGTGFFHVKISKVTKLEVHFIEERFIVLFSLKINSCRI